MANTIPDVILPAGTPVDLYAATSISVGVKIDVQNNSGPDVRLYAGATSPTTSSSGSTLLKTGVSAQNETGDAGAWAWCSLGGSVQVKEV
jgi:hypothetical protein